MESTTTTNWKINYTFYIVCILLAIGILPIIHALFFKAPAAPPQKPVTEAPERASQTSVVQPQQQAAQPALDATKLANAIAYGMTPVVEELEKMQKILEKSQTRVKVENSGDNAKFNIAVNDSTITDKESSENASIQDNASENEDQGGLFLPQIPLPRRKPVTRYFPLPEPKQESPPKKKSDAPTSLPVSNQTLTAVPEGTVTRSSLLY